MSMGKQLAADCTFTPPKPRKPMATFEDKQGRTWRVELDAMTIEDIRDTCEIDLVDLKSDPILQLRNNPRKLVDSIYMLCEDRAKELEIDQRSFAKAMPSPPDPMIEAMKEAIVNFFPSGRASFVREVFSKSEAMAEKNDRLGLARMEEILADPEIEERLKGKADAEFRKAIDDLFPMSSQAKE